MESVFVLSQSSVQTPGDYLFSAMNYLFYYYLKNCGK